MYKSNFLVDALLFGPRVSFISRFDMEESIRLVVNSSQNVSFTSPLKKVIICRVWNHKVEMKRLSIFPNVFTHVFYGSFKQTGAEVILEGRFMLHILIRWLLSAWLLIHLCGNTVTLIVGRTNFGIRATKAVNEYLLDIVVCVVIIFLRWLRRGDISAITNHIERVFGSSVVV